MKKIYISTIIFLSFCAAENASAQFVNIPDANFKAALVANLVINTNADSEIQITEAAAFNGNLDVSSLGIVDMTGIEAFTSAVGLDCSLNSITSLDLTYNTALTFLDCSSNNLTVLNLDYNTALVNLYCSSNALMCLDLSLNVNLVSVNCSSNFLSSLNLKNGNNATLTSMVSTNNGMLYCVQVDNVIAAATNIGWNEDTWSSYNLNCGTPSVAFFTANDPVCFGTPITFTDASMYNSEWIWDFGDGTSSNLSSPTHTYASTGSFSVTLIAKSCNSRDTATVGVIQGTSMYGTATYSMGVVGSGTAILYQWQPFYISFDTIQIVPLDAFGNFIFPHVADGNYMIQIFPDTTVYPTLSPTYYGNHWAWDSAGVFMHNCTADGYPNITMWELIPSSPGIGLMQGYVIEGPGFGRAQGDPVHGVVVKRGIALTNQIVQTTFTDANGQYTFGNIDFGTYTIYVDIPGLLRDSVYTFTVDASTNQYVNLYYVVDSTMIYIVPGIGIEDIESEDHNKLNVFPNPVKDNTTIQYTISAEANVQLSVYNVYGVKMQSLVNTHLQGGEYTYNLNTKGAGLKPGVYFVTLTANSKSRTMRIVVME